MRKRFLAGSFILALCLCLFPLDAHATVADVKYGRDPASITNARFVTDGEYFYYLTYFSVAQGRDETISSAIVKKSVKGGATTILHKGVSSNLDQPCLNLMDGYLYFSENDGIYRMRTDGTALECIYARDPARMDCFTFNEEILIVNDRLYLVRDDVIVTHQRSLISMNLDGSDVQTVLTDIGGILGAIGSRLYVSVAMGRSEGVTWYDCDTKTTGSTFSINKFPGGVPACFGISANGRLHIVVGYDWVLSEQDFARYEYYSCNPDGTDFRREKDIDRGSFTPITIIDNDVLYWLDGYLYKTSLYDRDTPVRISDREVDVQYSYHNGYVFTWSKSGWTGGEQLSEIYAVKAA